MFHVTIRGTHDHPNIDILQREVARFARDLGTRGFDATEAFATDGHGEVVSGHDTGSGEVDGPGLPVFVFPTVKAAEAIAPHIDSVSFLRALRDHEEQEGGGRVGVSDALARRIDALVNAAGE